MRCVAPALLVLALCVPAAAQTKPVGTFQLSQCEVRPAWLSFALLVDNADFTEAARCARETGIRWVLGIYSISPYQPVAGYARALRARADLAGLTPYLWAAVYHEEWYEYALTGGLPIPGLDHTNPAHHGQIVETVRWWVGHQHAAISAAFPGVPIAWITGLVNRYRGLGDALWRPLPPGASVIALEAYAPGGHTWADTAGLFLSHAIQSQSEPIVLIAHAFASADPAEPLWGPGPTEDIVNGFASALQHPRVWGSWIFTMESRPGILIGLEDLPYWRMRYEQALGVRP